MGRAAHLTVSQPLTTFLSRALPASRCWCSKAFWLCTMASWTFWDMPAKACSCSAASRMGRSSAMPMLAGDWPFLRMAWARLYSAEWYARDCTTTYVHTLNGLFPISNARLSSGGTLVATALQYRAVWYARDCTNKHRHPQWTILLTPTGRVCCDLAKPKRCCTELSGMPETEQRLTNTLSGLFPNTNAQRSSVVTTGSQSFADFHRIYQLSMVDKLWCINCGG